MTIKNYRGKTLVDVDFSNANLTNADFYDVTLIDSIISANLNDAKFIRVNLVRVDFLNDIFNNNTKFENIHSTIYDLK